MHANYLPPIISNVQRKMRDPWRFSGRGPRNFGVTMTSVVIFCFLTRDPHF